MSTAQTMQATAIDNREVILTNPWLTIGRGLWLITVIASVISFAALASRGSRALLAEPIVADGYVALAEYISYPGYAGLILASRYVMVGIFVATGLFIFWRKSNTMMGLIASLEVLMLPLIAGLGGQAPTFPETYVSTFLTVFRLNYGFVNVAWLVVNVLFIVLFPNGRFPSPRLKTITGVIFIALGLTFVVTMALGSVLPDSLGWSVMITSALIAHVIAIISAVYRYLKVSTPVEKQQTQWVMASLIVVALWAILLPYDNPFRSWDARAAPFALFDLFGTVVVASLVPLSIALAITRYHLWDVDVVIRKTLVYSLLTGSLILIYLGSVLVLQRIFTSLIGRDSELVTIISTLLIAALFLPLRRRIQLIIDRRFFRSKYDAARVLEDFASTARDETDLDTLTAELLRVIQETMQPSQLSIWLRDDTPLTGVESSTQNIRFRGYVADPPSNPPQ